MAAGFPGGINHETPSTAAFRAPLEARAPGPAARTPRRSRRTRPRRTASRPMRRQTASTTRAACVRKGWSTSAISVRSRTPESVRRPVRRVPVSSRKAEKTPSLRSDAARFCSFVTFAYIFIFASHKCGTRLACTSFGTYPYATKQLTRWSTNEQTDRGIESCRADPGRPSRSRRSRDRRAGCVEGNRRRLVRLERRNGCRAVRPGDRKAGQRDVRDGGPHQARLRPVLSRFFERDAVADVPLSQRPVALRPAGIRGLSARQRDARQAAQGVAQAR